MTCMKCNNDLATCTCPDLQERVEAIKKCPHLYIGADYLLRIKEQAKKNKTKEPTP